MLVCAFTVNGLLCDSPHILSAKLWGELATEPLKRPLWNCNPIVKGLTLLWKRQVVYLAAAGCPVPVVIYSRSGSFSVVVWLVVIIEQGRRCALRASWEDSRPFGLTTLEMSMEILADRYNCCNEAVVVCFWGIRYVPSLEFRNG